jgi:putative sigma-54 modulation protein
MNIKINSVRFSPTSKLESFVETKVKKLGQYSDAIIGAEVFLKLENTQDTDNKVAEIRVDIPGNELFVKKQAEVAQLVEHQPSKLRVASSNLVFRSKKLTADVAQG